MRLSDYGIYFIFFVAYSFMNRFDKNFCDSNFMETQIFHKMKYDLRGHLRSHNICNRNI